MNRQKILVTGASGLLGTGLTPRLEVLGDIIPVGRRNPSPNITVYGDLSDPLFATQLLDDHRPDIIVHTVALTDVDQCEKNIRAAFETNVQTTRNIVSWALKNAPETRLVYVSTDQVYGGPGPHGEESINPLNVYGMTKLWGEDVARNLEHSLILRTNFFSLGTELRQGFAGWLIESFQQKRSITLFEDVWFNPLYVTDLSNLIVAFIKRNLTGTFNVGASETGLSKAEFALKLATQLGLDGSNTKTGSVQSADLLAPRPHDMRMLVGKVESAMNIGLPSVEDGLRQLAKDWQESVAASSGIEA